MRRPGNSTRPRSMVAPSRRTLRASVRRLDVVEPCGVALAEGVFPIFTPLRPRPSPHPHTVDDHHRFGLHDAHLFVRARTPRLIGALHAGPVSLLKTVRVS